MIRRRINQGAIKGKRFQVSDVPDYSTPRGTSKSNDEMRKLAMDLTSFSQEVQGKIDEVKATIPPKTTTTTGGGTTTGPTETPKPPVLPVLEVWRDGNAIVVGTRIWDFTQSDTIRFEVNNLGNQRAQIKAHTLRTLNTMWGTYNGGYALEVPATPGGAINHPGYIPKTSISQPFVVQKNRSLIHWVGDTASQEPDYEAALSPSATPRAGFNNAKPSFELAAWTAYTQGVTISGTAYDTTTVKYRVTPNLQIFDPFEFYSTTQHVTRIFFKDSDTIKPHVRIDDPVVISSGITDPREYTAKIWLDIDDDAFNIENLGASGTNVGEVYKTKIGRTFYLRRLRTQGSIVLTEDDDYINISGILPPGITPVIDTIYNLPDDQSIPRLRVFSHTDIVSGGNAYNHYLRGLYYAGNVSMYYDQYDRIVISGADNTFVDNCASGIGEGEIFHELVTDGSTRTFELRKLLAGSGIAIQTLDHDVVVSAIQSNYAIDNCEESSGEGLIYHDQSISGTETTFHLRKIVAGSGIQVETIDHDIVITSTVSGVTYDHLAVASPSGSLIRLHGSDTSNDDILLRGSGATTVTYVDDDTIDIFSPLGVSSVVDNCASGIGDGLIYHDSETISGTTTYNLRKIQAGSGIAVTTLDHDILIESTVSGVTYDHLAIQAPSGSFIRLRGSDATYDDILLIGSGSTTVEYIDDDTIQISSPIGTVSSVDNCLSGVGDGLIYHDSETISGNTTYYLRKLLAGSGIGITTEQHDVVIRSTVSGVTYDHLAVDVPGGAYIRLRGSDATNDDILIQGSGTTIVSYVDDDTIQISSTNSIYEVDNCISGTGTGLVYHDNTTADNTTTFHLRKLLAGSGINIDTEDHDIRISASGIEYDIDNCQESDGQGLVYHDDTTDAGIRTFHLRKILAGSGIGVQTSDHSIIITASGTPAIGISIDNCELGSGTGLIFHDQTVSGTDTTFHLRKILAGSGIEVETVDHDVVVRNTVTDHDTKYDHLAVTHPYGALVRLHDSNDINDDILLTSSGNTVAITRTSDDVINFEAVSSGIKNVIGENVDDCTSLSTSTEFNWYIDYADDLASGTRSLRFRTFGVQQDLYLSQCGSDYIFTVNTIGIDNRNNLYPSIGVFQKNVQNGGQLQKELYFRGLRPGSGISLYLDESDDKSDIVINSTYKQSKWYDVGTVCSGSTNEIFYLQSGTRGTGDSENDPRTFLFKGIAAGSGIAIDNSDPCSISIRTVTTSGIPSPQVDRIYYATDWRDESGIPNPCETRYPYSIYGDTDTFSGTYASNTIPGTVSGLAYEVTAFKFRSLLDFPYNNGVKVVLKDEWSVLKDRSISISTRNQNWQCSLDNCAIIDGESGAISNIHFNLPSTTWHPLYFFHDNILENITPCLEPANKRVFTNNLPGTTPYWYFLPLDTNNSKGHGVLTIADYVPPSLGNFNTDDTTVWLVSVRLCLVTGSPTNDAGVGGVSFPQIAIFRNDVFWRTLDVDVRISDYAVLRQALIYAQIMDVGAASPRKVWLHGSAIVQLRNGQKLDVRYRHMTGSTRYHDVVEGSIDIVKVGAQNTYIVPTYNTGSAQTRVVINGYSF